MPSGKDDCRFLPLSLGAYARSPPDEIRNAFKGRLSFGRCFMQHLSVREKSTVNKDSAHSLG